MFEGGNVVYEDFSASLERCNQLYRTGETCGYKRKTFARAMITLSAIDVVHCQQNNNLK